MDRNPVHSAGRESTRRRKAGPPRRRAPNAQLIPFRMRGTRVSPIVFATQGTRVLMAVSALRAATAHISQSTVRHIVSCALNTSIQLGREERRK